MQPEITDEFLATYPEIYNWTSSPDSYRRPSLDVEYQYDNEQRPVSASQLSLFMDPTPGRTMATDPPGRTSSGFTYHEVVPKKETGNDPVTLQTSHQELAVRQNSDSSHIGSMITTPGAIGRHIVLKIPSLSTR
jgi:hypothetical protein